MRLMAAPHVRFDSPLGADVWVEYERCEFPRCTSHGKLIARISAKGAGAWDSFDVGDLVHVNIDNRSDMSVGICAYQHEEHRKMEEKKT